MSNYEILKASGHSAQKALEIELNAKRGDAYSIDWIAMCRKQVENFNK